ncbi:MAG: tetratricopeptide repeat protein [Labilithrix sp.]|nr:tetratricopeptide repeat protein [Labilithrix sp.]MCW5832855.1 tetratricopeptide repeat protein [Labilithrix sp.]
MGSRAIWRRGALGLVLGGAAACGGEARSRPAEDLGALVIPPLEVDAGAPAAVDPPAPVTVRTALTIRARDPRRAGRRPRSRALLMTEVQGLQRSLASAPASAPERPALRRRLAEAYDELAYTASGPDAARARDEAIREYVAIAAEHPSYPALDEVLYYLGLAHELNGDAASARRAYLDLVTKHPRSRLVPLAYFAFGELFSAEAADDPSKDALALQAYEQVMTLADADEPVQADALLRAGETLLRMGRDADADGAFARLRARFPESDAAAAIPRGR